MLTNLIIASSLTLALALGITATANGPTGSTTVTLSVDDIGGGGPPGAPQ